VLSLATWGVAAGLLAGFFFEATPLGRRDIFQNIPVAGAYWKRKIEEAERKD
ncbi:hypothetical protein HK405_009172, partial [Cladochytrium tenue]